MGIVQSPIIRFGLFLSVILIACGPEKKTPSTKQPVAPAVYKKVSPDFNADSAYFFVERQVLFGPRVTNSDAHKQCGDWLVKELKKYSDRVVEQKTSITHFDGTRLQVRNIIAEIRPQATRRILLAAHWDSRPKADEDFKDQDKPILGANDGASGVGVLLEVARILKQTPPNVGVDIILFDAEDLGDSEVENSFCLGSQYWSKNPHIPGYKADFGILLDMVGAANAKFAWEEVSYQFALPVLQRVWEKAGLLGYGKWFIYYQKGGITDDHYYVNMNAKIPMIDIIHYDENTQGFPGHWHTHRDNMQVIDKSTLKAVGQTLLEVLYTY